MTGANQRGAAAWARRLIPGLWAGLLLCIGLVAAPAAFATLAPHDAGRVVARLFAQEAYLSLALAVVLLVLERGPAAAQAATGQGSRLSLEMVLCLAAVFLTVLGYFALQPMMAAARAGEGAWSFGQLHAVSLGCYGLKTLAVGWLAARAAAR